MPNLAGCLYSPDATQRFEGVTGIVESSAGTAKPTPSVEKIQRSTRGSRRRLPPPAGPEVWRHHAPIGLKGGRWPRVLLLTDGKH